MMAKHYLHISFGWAGGDPKIGELEPVFGKALDWIRYAPNCWIVWTSSDADKWYSRLMPHLGPKDRMFIVAWRWETATVWRIMTFSIMPKSPKAKKNTACNFVERARLSNFGWIMMNGKNERDRPLVKKSLIILSINMVKPLNRSRHKSARHYRSSWVTSR